MPVTTTTPRHNPWLALLGFVAVVAVVGLVGALAATSAREIYARLNQPEWAPPAELFGPMWTVMYLLIAVAGWWYWRTDGETSAYSAYGIGLLLNLLWTPLFFAGRSTMLALLDIVALDFVVLVTIVLFARRSRLAAGLLVPYVGWLLYATALNSAVVVLN
ncbi:TspO/MBR family protein [Amycolatopsis sp. NPDC059021]|uniref:TspO/MBR family protein n=1 Tax=Amycolatopsis sp. NPDC059021 TaxID=3346704 RepID=UPI00366C0478